MASQAQLSFLVYSPNASTPWVIGTPSVPRDSLVYLSASFVDTNSGVLIDPPAVYISASAPDTSSSTYINTSSSTPIHRQSTGIYYAYVDVINGPGDYLFKWESTGNQGSMYDQTLTVTDSVFTAMIYIIVYHGLGVSWLGDITSGLGYMQLGSI